MGRKEILTDSVLKLLDLGVSDEEIESNLLDAGIKKEEARELIREAKQKKNQATQNSEKTFEKSKEETLPEVTPLKDEQSQFNKPPPFTPTQQTTSPEIISLWEKGILSNVDTKLEEMRSLKKEVETVIDSKVNERIDVTVKRVNVLFDSQKALILAKVNSELEKKSGELTELIDMKVGELKSLDVEAKKKLAALREETTSLTNLKQDMETFLTDSEKTRNDLNKQINQALSLEQKVIDGLKIEAEKKINEMAFKKEAELNRKVETKIQELTDLQTKIDPSRINRELEHLEMIAQELEKKAKSNEIFIKYKEEMKEWSEDYLKEFSIALKKDLDEIIHTKSHELEDKISDKIHLLEDLSEKVNVEEISSVMEELDAYKTQFVNVVRQNVDSYNKSKKMLTEHAVEQSKAIDKRIKAIDEKINELTSFEKTFAKEMGLTIDKLTRKK
jgi:DNA repair exonuclease SbcCD ATPase subunit